MSIFNRVLVYNGYISPSSNLETILAGNSQLTALGLTSVYGICCDPSGNVYISDPEQHVIVKINPRGKAYIFAGQLGIAGDNGDKVKGPSESLLNKPMGLDCDKNGNVFVADSGNNQIRKITADSKAYLIAGDKNGYSGYTNTWPSKFKNPQDVAIDESGNLFIADTGNNVIRKLKYGTRTLITVAGNGTAGDQGGYPTSSKLNGPSSVAVNINGEVFIGDAKNYKIKKISRNGYVSTFSGSGVKGDAIGKKNVCQYMDIFSVVTDRYADLYVGDYDEAQGGRILRVNEDGTAFEAKGYSTPPSKAAGITWSRSRSIYVAETQYIDVYYTSSSSISSSSVSESSFSTLSSDTTISGSGSESSKSSLSNSSESSSFSSYSSISSLSPRSLSSLSSEGISNSSRSSISSQSSPSSESSIVNVSASSPSSLSSESSSISASYSTESSSSYPQCVCEAYLCSYVEGTITDVCDYILDREFNLPMADTSNCNLWIKIVTTPSANSVFVYKTLADAQAFNPSESIANGSGIDGDARIELTQTLYPYASVGTISLSSTIPHGDAIAYMACEEISTSSSSSLDSSSTSTSSSSSGQQSLSSHSTSSSSSFMSQSSFSSFSGSSYSSSSLDSSSSSSLFDMAICLDGRPTANLMVSGQNITLENGAGNTMYWDFGGAGQYQFTFVGESITRAFGDQVYSVVYNDDVRKCILVVLVDNLSSSTSSKSTSSSSSIDSSSSKSTSSSSSIDSHSSKSLSSASSRSSQSSSSTSINSLSSLSTSSSSSIDSPSSQSLSSKSNSSLSSIIAESQSSKSNSSVSSFSSQSSSSTSIDSPSSKSLSSLSTSSSSSIDSSSSESLSSASSKSLSSLSTSSSSSLDSSSSKSLSSASSLSTESSGSSSSSSPGIIASESSVSSESSSSSTLSSDSSDSSYSSESSMSSQSIVVECLAIPNGQIGSTFQICLPPQVSSSSESSSLSTLSTDSSDSSLSSQSVIVTCLAIPNGQIGTTFEICPP